MSNENPNAIAFSRMNAVRPVWTGMRRLSSLPGLSGRIILHAGPKFRDFSSIPVPVRNSLISIILREKWAENVESAEMLLQDGSISVEPAQEYNVYVPLAGAAGPSTMLIEVRDEAGDGAAYSPLNEGMELCTRLGILHPDLPAHLEWLDGVLAPWIDGLLTERPLPLGPVLREAIAQQDDCHSCTVAGSRLLAAALLDRDGGRSNTSAIEAFLDGAPAFALNVWMAMCGLVARAAGRPCGWTAGRSSRQRLPLSCRRGTGRLFPSGRRGSPSGLLPSPARQRRWKAKSWRSSTWATFFARGCVWAEPTASS